MSPAPWQGSNLDKPVEASLYISKMHFHTVQFGHCLIFMIESDSFLQWLPIAYGTRPHFLAQGSRPCVVHP